MSFGGQKLERTKTLYISSESVDYFTSSNRVNISLNEILSPSDGFNLVYCVRSVGFNSTVYNISEEQGNNRINFEITYDNTELTAKVVQGPQYPEYSQDGKFYNFSIIKYDDGPNPRPLDTTTVIHHLIIPDGLYTLSQLFAYLSTASDGTATNNSTWTLPSGYLYDAREKHNLESNIVPIGIQWDETPFGFTILFRRGDQEIKDSYRNDDDYPGEIFTTYKVFSRITSFSIIPAPLKPLLFNTLFTNYGTSRRSTPISIPTSNYNLTEGLNPHLGVKFVLNFMDGLSDESRGLNPMNLTASIVEIGNERLYDIPNGHFPTNPKINFGVYTAYYKPILNPIYTDISISLPNYAMDEKGHKNILSRIFNMGVGDGNTSLYRQFENPKMVSLAGMDAFGAIVIEFTSQSNKWNFFNLEFSIELEISEVKEEHEDDETQNVNIAPSDPISDTAAEAGISSRRPLPASHFAYHSRGVQIHKRTRHL